MKEKNRQTTVIHDAENADGYVLRSEVAQIVREELSSLRIYVLESEITDAQNAVKAVVSNSSF